VFRGAEDDSSMPQSYAVLNGS